MTEGTNQWGRAVPINGESTITQVTAATDILSITGASGQTGDFLVAQDSSGNEKFVVDSNGQITAAGGLAITSGQYFTMGTPVTTAPTTGLTLGDLFLAMDSATPQIGVCTDTTGNTIKYFTADTSTFGRATA